MDKKFQQMIHEDRRRLENPYAHLMSDGTLDALLPVSTSAVHRTDKDPKPEAVIDLAPIRRKVHKAGRLTRSKIEAIARDLQARLWRIRGKLFPNTQAVDPLAVLDPRLALVCIGFRFELLDSLGQQRWDGKLAEVAGVIDRSDRTVRISRRFDPPVRKFTAAHELGHALLHDGQGLHRDRALDGSQLGSARDRGSTEWEADVFAAYFLMPEKQVRAAFEYVFKARKFVLNEDTAFALNAGDLETLQADCRDIRDLSRLLSRTTRYDGVQFHSLAERFGVSPEAMAIRLEELRIIGRPDYV